MTREKKLHRRQVLKMMAVGTCGAACHNVLNPGGMVAYAAAPAGRIRRVITIFLYGGCCSYGFAPQHNAGAQAKYGVLYRNPEQATSIGHSDQSLHQAFGPFVAQANASAPSVALIVGTAAMNAKGQFSRSHEEAQTANERILLDYTLGTALGMGAAVAQEIGHPYSLISFGGASDFSLGGTVPARSVASLENAGRPSFSQDDWFKLIEANAKAHQAPAATDAQTYVHHAITGMDQNIETLRTISQINPQFSFPNTGIGRNMRDVTKLITGNVGNIFFIPYGGFDTHGDQGPQHQSLFTNLNNALVPLVQNLKAIPGQSLPTAWDETVVVTMTDFGRTFVNNADGTDHGLCYTQMVFGGPVRGGVYGDPPNAQKYLSEGSGYQGPRWAQFSAGQPMKEIVQMGMGLSNVPFPNYYGNLYAPIGFLNL